MRKQKKVTKHDQVRQHLKSKRVITSLDAIKLYSATRLSAIIFNLRHKDGWDITMTPTHIKDRNRNDCIYGVYKLISTKEESALQKKYEHSIIPAGKKIEKTKKKSTKILKNKPAVLKLFGNNI